MMEGEPDFFLPPADRWLRALGYRGRPPRVRTFIVNASNIAQLLKVISRESCEEL